MPAGVRQGQPSRPKAPAGHPPPPPPPPVAPGNGRSRWGGGAWRGGRVQGPRPGRRLGRAAGSAAAASPGAMAAEVVVVGSCMTDLVRLVPGVLPQTPGRRSPEVRGAQGVTLPGAQQRLSVPPKGRPGRVHPTPLALGREQRVSRLPPGRDRRSGAGARFGGAELRAEGREARSRARLAAARQRRSCRWGRLGPGDVSPAQSTSRGACGNGEKLGRVVCWSFDQLSVTAGRREARVCVLSCAGRLGLSLARNAAFHSEL